MYWGRLVSLLTLIALAMYVGAVTAAYIASIGPESAGLGKAQYTLHAMGPADTVFILFLVVSLIGFFPAMLLANTPSERNSLGRLLPPKVLVLSRFCLSLASFFFICEFISFMIFMTDASDGFWEGSVALALFDLILSAFFFVLIFAFSSLKESPEEKPLIRSPRLVHLAIIAASFAALFYFISAFMMIFVDQSNGFRLLANYIFQSVALVILGFFLPLISLMLKFMRNSGYISHPNLVFFFVETSVTLVCSFAIVITSSLAALNSQSNGISIPRFVRIQLWILLSASLIALISQILFLIDLGLTRALFLSLHPSGIVPRRPSERTPLVEEVYVPPSAPPTYQAPEDFAKNENVDSAMYAVSPIAMDAPLPPASYHAPRLGEFEFDKPN